jgi:hypothetical protein
MLWGGVHRVMPAMVRTSIAGPGPTALTARISKSLTEPGSVSGIENGPETGIVTHSVVTLYWTDVIGEPPSQPSTNEAFTARPTSVAET